MANVMESICPACQQLVSQGQPHSQLLCISTLHYSQLYKCRCCNSFLHKYHHDWEILSAGDYETGDGCEVQPEAFTLRSAV